MSTLTNPDMCTTLFDEQGFAEHQFSRSWPGSENAHNSWTTWFIWIKLHPATGVQNDDEAAGRT